MKAKQWITYVLLIALLAGLVTIAGGTSLCHKVSEEAAFTFFGVPLLVYFRLARFFHAGEVVNILLLFVVSFSYLGVLFMPLLYLCRGYKLSLVMWQVGLIVVHVLIGVMMLRI